MLVRYPTFGESGLGPAPALVRPSCLAGICNFANFVLRAVRWRDGTTYIDDREAQSTELPPTATAYLRLPIRPLIRPTHTKTSTEHRGVDQDWPTGTGTPSPLSCIADVGFKLPVQTGQHRIFKPDLAGPRFRSAWHRDGAICLSEIVGVGTWPLTWGIDAQRWNMSLDSRTHCKRRKMANHHLVLDCCSKPHNRAKADPHMTAEDRHGEHADTIFQICIMPHACRRHYRHLIPDYRAGSMTALHRDEVTNVIVISNLDAADPC